MKIISIIKVEIESIAPLDISDGEEILLDNETGMAYIPATTVAGSFRAYLDSIEVNSDRLFGNRGENRSKSNLYIRDLFTDNKGLEERTIIKMDKKTGTSVDGIKIDKQYLKSGLNFRLNFKIESTREDIGEDKKLIYKCLNALDNSWIRIGCNKSSGLGIFKVKKVEQVDFDFNDKNEWLKYIKDNHSNTVDITKRVLDGNEETSFVQFNIKGSFTSPVLIGISKYYDPEDVDNKSMMSGDEYIVPGSGFKGVLRFRIEKIANYFGNSKIAKEMFGDTEIDGKSENILSRVFVREAVIDTSGFEQTNYNRIKIDKFTAGVRKGGLVDDTPVQGSVEFNIIYRKQGNIEKDKYAIGIIALALRDFGNENLSIGRDYKIGRGRFKAESMSIIEEKTEIEIDFIQKTISNGEYLDKYIKAVRIFDGEVDHA